MQKDLGLVTAYGAALEGGYTGTYEQYKEKMMELLEVNLTGLGNEYDDTELVERIEQLESKYGTIPVNPSTTPTQDGSMWITT